MMDEKQIGEALLAMTNAITAKIGRQPAITPKLWIDNDGLCWIQIYADRYGRYDVTGTITGDTAGEAIAKAWKIIHALPSAEAAARDRFAKAVGAAIEAGKDAGIDLEHINPLKEMMVRLSENAITKAVE